MTSLGSGPIKFSTLKTRYVADSSADYDADGDSNLHGKYAKTYIQLSWFRGATLNNGSVDSDVPSSGQISFNNDFRNKTFGSLGGGGSGSGSGSGSGGGGK